MPTPNMSESMHSLCSPIDIDILPGELSRYIYWLINRLSVLDSCRVK